MPEEKIVIPVDIQLNEAEQKLNRQNQDFQSLRTEFTDSPEMTQIMNANVERSLAAIEQMQQRVQEAKNSAKAVAEEISKTVQEGLADLDITSKMLSGNGTFSQTLAKQMFGGFSQAVQKELNLQTPTIVNAQRNAVSLKGSRFDADTATHEAMSILRGNGIAKQFVNTDKKQLEQYVRALIPNVLGINRMREYTNQRWDTAAQQTPHRMTPATMIPAGYQEFFNKGFQNAYNGTDAGKYLNREGQRRLGALLGSSAAAMRAAEKTPGMLSVGDNGRASQNVVTQKMYEDFRGALQRDFENRARGRDSAQIDLHQYSPDEERRQVNRMLSGTAGRSLSAMQDTEVITNTADYWDAARPGGRRIILARPRAEREQYEIRKYKFEDLFKPKGQAKPQMVMIDQSLATEQLGLTGSHNRMTDLVMEMNLAGYDDKNPEHRAMMAKITNPEGFYANDKKYRLQAIHGTGQEVTAKFIEMNAYQKVYDQYKDIAAKIGLSGDNFWTMFQNITPDFGSTKEIARYMDAVNKMWTGSIGASGNQSKRKTAIVDFEKLTDEQRKILDGVGFAAEGVLPAGSGQYRFMVGGKGTLQTVGGQTIGEALLKAGLDTKLPGVYGPVDVSDASIVIDKSQIKNMGAFKGLKTNEELNSAATDMMRIFVPRIMATNEEAETRANMLGAQVMQYATLPQEFIIRHAAEVQQYIRALQTDTGLRDFIARNPDSPIAKKIANGELTYTDEPVLQMRDDEIASVLTKSAEGAWIDVGRTPMIQNQMLSTNLVEGIARFKGMSTDQLRQTIGNAYLKATGRKQEVSDEALRGMFALDAFSGVDFTHPEEEYFTVHRSPSGIGEIARIKNFAKEALDVFPTIGLSTEGLLISQEGREQQAGADVDGDRVKTIYGEQGEYLAASAEAYRKLFAESDIAKPGETPIKLPENMKLNPNDAAYVGFFVDALQKAGGGMGSADTIAARAAALGLDQKQFAIAAFQANDMYRIFTDMAKNTTTAERTALIEDQKLAFDYGRPWQRLAKGYSSLFNVNGFDNLPIPDQNRVFTHNGISINLDELEKMNIDRVALRSTKVDTMLQGMMIGELVSGENGTNTSGADAVLEALRFLDGEHKEEFTHSESVRNALRKIKLYDAVGAHGRITDEEEQWLADELDKAETEISEESGNDRNKYKQLSKEYGVDLLATALIKNGMTSMNLRKKGYDENALINRTVLDEAKKTEQQISEAEADEKRKTYRLRTERLARRMRAKTGEQIKAESAEDDELDEESFLTPAIEAERDIKRAEKRTQEIKASNEGPSRFLIEKFLQEREQLGSIRGLISKEQRKLNHTPDPGYSQLGFARRQLSEMLSYETIAAMKMEAKSPEEIAEIDRDILSRRTEMAMLDRLIEQEAIRSVDDAFGKIRQTAYHTKGSGALQAKNRIDSIVRNASAQKEALKNEKTWDQTTETWIDERAREVYDNASARERVLRQQAAQYTPLLLEEETTAADREFNKLTRIEKSPIESIRESFRNREESIQQYIRDMSEKETEWSEKLKETYRDDQGKLRHTYEEGTKEYDDINRYLDKIADQKKKAEEYLTGGDLSKQQQIAEKNATFQMQQARERSLLQSENTVMQSGRWRYQNLQVGATALERNIWNSRMRAEEFGQQYKDYEQQYENAVYKRDEAERKYKASGTENDKLDFEKAAEAAENYKTAMDNAAAAQQAFGAGGGVVKGTLDTITNGLTRLTAQFGRRLFHKAQQEAKQFVVQFSTQMSTIQSITMKSDEEMVDVRRNTIEKARSLHTSVANVADVEASLYRQGQSDAEVSERTDAIVKFATVTGVKVTAATKYLTSAIQNGLVGSVQEAMDVLVALGDSAATTAEEISKGMQKSAAAAKNAGVSYEELTSMLTIITSKTQLGGATAGTAQQTIFSRMTRVTNSGSVTDASGETTTINDVEKALQGAGINLRNPGNPREIRNVFEVLRDLSKVWNELDDLRKGNISYYMAGGRQVNMFQTLMEGMAENGGKDQDEYLGLAEGSKGITQSKYEIAIDNIQTKLTDLKTTFDSVVENIVSDGTVGGVLDFASNIIGGIDAISEKLGGLPAIFSVVTVAILAMAAKLAVAGAVTSAAWAPILGIMAGAGVLLLGGALLSAFNTPSEEEVQKAKREKLNQERTAYENQQTQKQDKLNKDLENAHKLIDEYKTLETDELDNTQVEALRESLVGLGAAFPDLSASIADAGSQQSVWTGIVEQADKKVQDFNESVRIAKLSNNRARLNEGFRDFTKDLTDFIDIDERSAESTEELRNQLINNRNYVVETAKNSGRTFSNEISRHADPIGRLVAIYGEDMVKSWFDSNGMNYYTEEYSPEVWSDFRANKTWAYDDKFNFEDFINGFFQNSDEHARAQNAAIGYENKEKFREYFDNLFTSGGLMYEYLSQNQLDNDQIASIGQIMAQRYAGFDINDETQKNAFVRQLYDEVNTVVDTAKANPAFLQSQTFTRNGIEVTKQAGQTWEDVWDSASEEVRQAILEEIEALSESANEAVDAAVEEIVEDTEQPLVETDEAFKQGLDRLKTRGRARAEGPLVTDFSFRSEEKWWKDLSDEDLIAKLIGTWDFGMGPVERTEDMLREMSRERLELLAKSYDKKIETQPAAETEAQTVQTRGITQEQYDRVLAKLKSGEPQGDIDKQVLQQYVPPNPELQTLAGLNDTLTVRNGNVVFNQNVKTEEEIAAEEAYNNTVFETAASAAKRKVLLHRRMLDLASDDWTTSNERFAQDVGEMRKAIAVAVAEDTGINDKTATQLSLMASTNAGLPFYNMNPAEVKTSVNRGRAKFMAQFFEDNLDTVAKIVQQVDSANEEQLNAVIEDYQAKARVVEESIEPRVLEVMKERVTINADQLRRQTEEAARAQQVAVSEGTDFTSIIYAMSDVTKAAYKSFAENVNKVVEEGQPEVEKDVAETVAEEVAPVVTESGLTRPTEEGFAQLNTIKGTLPNAGQTAMSAYEAVLSSMTAKDRGYRDEWRALYGYLLTSDYSEGNTIKSQMDNIGNVDNFKNFSIFQQNDHTLAQLMSDIDNSLKDRSELFSYVAEKVFGKDFDEFVRNLKDSYKNIEKSKVKAQRAREGRATYEEYKEIADAMMVDVEDIDGAQIDRYEESLSIAERQNEFNARSTVGGMMSQWLEQRAAAGEELGDFGSVWEDYLSSITDINAKNQQIAYMRQLQSSGMQFGLEAQRDQNDKIIGYKVTSNYIAPEAREQQSVFTPEEIRVAARRVLAGNFSDLGSNENLAQAVSQRYGDLTALKGLTEEQLNTLYGQTLRRDIEVQFKTEGIQEQEQAGRIVNGIASAVEQIGKGNVLESFKGVQAIRTMATEELDAYAAYQRIASNGGVGTQKDWATVGSYYGIDTTPYTRGQRNIGELGGVVADWHDVMVNSGNTIARAELERAYAAYLEETGKQLEGDISELSTDYLTKWYGQDALSKYMTGFERDQNGNWIIRATPTSMLTYADWEESRRSVVDEERLRQEQATSIYGMLTGASSFEIANNMLRSLSINGSDNMRKYISNLLESGALDKIESLDDLLALIYSQSSMGQYSSYYSGFRYANAAPYITAQLNGERDTLNTLAGNKEMSNYLRSIVGDWDVLSAEGYALTEADRARLLTIDRVQAAEEIEKTTPALEGLRDIVTSLVGATSDTRRQDVLRSSFGGSISEYVNAMRNINDSETVASYLGVDQNIVRGWDTDKRKEEIENRAKDWQDTLKEAIKTMFTGVDAEAFTDWATLVDAIQSGGDQVNASQLNVITAFFETMGQSVEDFYNNGKFNTNGTFDQFGEARESYDKQQRFLGTQRLIANAARNAGTREEFQSIIEEMKDTDTWKDLEEMYPNMAEEIKTAMVSDENWESARQTLIKGLDEVRAATEPDNEAMRMMSRINEVFGENAFERMAEGTYTPTEGFDLYNAMTSPENADVFAFMSSIEEGRNILSSFGEETEENAKNQQNFANVLKNQSIKAMRLYGDRTDDVANTLTALRKGGQDAQSALKGINQQMTQIGQNKFYMDKWRSGDRSDETAQAIAAITGFDAKSLKEGKVLDSLLEKSFASQNEADLSTIQTWADMLMEDVNQYFADNEIDVKGPNINLEAGEMDASALQAALDAAGALTQETAAQLMAILEAFGVQGTLEEIQSGDTVLFRFKVEGFTGGSFNKGGGGGGGGGGKSAAQELIDKLKKEQATFDHQIKMIQSQESKYEGAGEYLNLNAMLGLENEAQFSLIDNLEKSIDKLKEQLAQTKEGSDDWYALRDAIMSYEEAIESANRAIEDNTRKQTENLKKARQTTQTLEQALKGQIEEQKQIDRDMLGGTVSLQQQILDVIKQRYQEEWDQVDKDLQKKRDALQEEMNMIDERLRRRTEAEDDAEKREELAEYRRQAALIAADPTRSKDYNELMKKIREGEQEESRKTAERNAEYQKRMLEQESESLDKASQEGAERLENFLKDANNMAIEINSILEGSYEDAIKWFMANSEEYKNGLDAMQKQFINNVEDTWKQMNHIIDTYWPEINEIIAGGREAYVERMKETDQYRFGSETDREQLVTEWGEQWDNWINAWKTGATYSHEDEWSKTLYDSVKNISGDSPAVKKALEDTSADVKAILAKLPDDITADEVLTLQKEFYKRQNEIGASSEVRAIYDMLTFGLGLEERFENGEIVFVDTKADQPTVQNDNNDIETNKPKGIISIIKNQLGFDEGGLVDFTGPAMVHGSALRPEAFLDAEDTALMRAMLDSMSRVRVRTLAGFIDPTKFGGNTQTIGDVNITITEAKFEDDADIEAVAARVGEAFVQQLNQQGFTTGKFAL